MNVRREDHGEAVLFVVDGQVDMYTSPDLLTQLRGAVRDRIPVIVVDLGAVSFMDSSGIATLIDTMKGVQRHGGALRLASLSAPVRGVFEVSKLNLVFDIYDTREDALGA